MPLYRCPHASHQNRLVRLSWNTRCLRWKCPDGHVYHLRNGSTDPRRRFISKIGDLGKNAEKILISGYLSKEQTMDILRDLSMGGLTHVRWVTGLARGRRGKDEDDGTVRVAFRLKARFA